MRFRVSFFSLFIKLSFFFKFRLLSFHTHPDRLERLVLGELGLRAELANEPLEEVDKRLGRGHDVKRRGHRGAVLKITHPELGSRKLPFCVRLVADRLVRVVHHGDEQVQQDDHIDHTIAAEHQQAPEAGVALDAGQFEVLQIDQAERSPEERLKRLEKTGEETEKRI